MRNTGVTLYGGSEPITETLLGRVTQWKPTGCIAHKHRNGVITEPTRFRFPMNCDDKDVAKCFDWRSPGSSWLELPRFSDSSV